MIILRKDLSSSRIPLLSSQKLIDVPLMYLKFCLLKISDINLNQENFLTLFDT